MGETEPTTFRFGAVVTATGDVLDDAVVTVADGRIAGIGSGGSAGAVDVNRPDQTLIPGFVDAHVHLVFGYEPTHNEVREAAEHMSLEELTERAAAHAAECLDGGVTTVRDCGDRDFATVELRTAIESGRLRGPRLAIAGPPVTVGNGHLHWCGGVVSDGFAPVIGRLRDHGVDWVKVMASGGKMTAESNPSRPQFSGDQIATLTALAHEAGLPVAAHAHSVDTIGFCAHAGVDSIEHCSWKTDTGEVTIVDETADLIIERGIAVVLTMAGIQRGLLDGFESSDHHLATALASSDTGSLRGDFEWARTMLARGATMVIASDAGVRLTPFAGFADSVRCGIEALDITAADAIEMATRVPAGLLGLGNDIGTIQVGRIADLVALDGLVAPGSRDLPPVAAVWQAGKPIG